MCVCGGVVCVCVCVCVRACVRACVCVCVCVIQVLPVILMLFLSQTARWSAIDKYNDKNFYVHIT